MTLTGEVAGKLDVKVPPFYGLSSGHGECCLMRKNKPSDNLLDHIAGLTWALSFHLDTSVHGSTVISMSWPAARTPCFQNPKPSFCFFMVEFLQSVSSIRASSNNNEE